MRVFITGMTGTLGTALAKLHHARGDEVFGCSRNELNGIEWLEDHPDLDGSVSLIFTDAANLGDHRSPVGRLLSGIKRLYHCAAMKHVQICECQPMECLEQNVALTWMISMVCQDQGVPMVLASSDKAFRPEGVYGASKLMAERIVLAAGGAAVRLVNIIGSSGSVLAYWSQALKRGEPIRLTDTEMTRYFIAVGEAAQLMADAKPGLTVADAKAINMGTLARRLVGPDWFNKVELTGPRPGECKHQWLTETRCSETDRQWDTDELAARVRAL